MAAWMVVAAEELERNRFWSSPVYLAYTSYVSGQSQEGSLLDSVQCKKAKVSRMTPAF